MSTGLSWPVSSMTPWRRVRSSGTWITTPSCSTLARVCRTVVAQGHLRTCNRMITKAPFRVVRGLQRRSYSRQLPRAAHRIGGPAVPGRLAG